MVKLAKPTIRGTSRPRRDMSLRFNALLSLDAKFRSLHPSKFAQRSRGCPSMVGVWCEHVRCCPSLVAMGRRIAGHFERSADACSLGCVMDDPDPSMSRSRSRESRACPIMSSRWIPGGITPALTERRKRCEFASGVDGKIGEANHPRNEPAPPRDVASVQRFVIQTTGHSAPHTLAGRPSEVEHT